MAGGDAGSGDAGGTGNLTETLIIVNLVLSFISTILLGMKFRVKCCCGELNIRGKNAPPSSSSTSSPDASASPLPRQSTTAVSETPVPQQTAADHPSEPQQLQIITIPANCSGNPQTLIVPLGYRESCSARNGNDAQKHQRHSAILPTSSSALGDDEDDAEESRANSLPPIGSKGDTKSL